MLKLSFETSRDQDLRIENYITARDPSHSHISQMYTTALKSFCQIQTEHDGLTSPLFLSRDILKVAGYCRNTAGCRMIP